MWEGKDKRVSQFNSAKIHKGDRSVGTRLGRREPMCRVKKTACVLKATSIHVGGGRATFPPVFASARATPLPPSLLVSVPAAISHPKEKMETIV